jgi:uncharacterized protein YjiK
MNRLGTNAVLVAVFFLSACRGGDFSKAEAEELAARQRRFSARLALPDSGPLARWVLPPQLLEVSGLALTPDGNILAHNDENPVLSVIDPRRGVVTRQFSFGERGLHGDFEGIAVSGGEIFLLVSNGTIYRLREGGDGDNVPYTTIDTKLGKECEFEGIAVDRAGMILLACKNVAKKGPKDQLVIYRWDPRTSQASMLAIPYSAVIGDNGWKDLHPSDITVEPTTGNYVVIAAQEKALIVVTPQGQVVSSGPLPEKPRQAEGVAIASDGILYVSDEGSSAPGTLSLYRWPLSPASASGDSIQAAEQTAP